MKKFNLTQRTFLPYAQDLLKNLYNTNKYSDVTLVCDENKHLQAHKFVLSACSPIFENILDNTDQAKSFIYLRGVKYEEISSILQFIYLGETTFYQDRMNELLSVAQDLMVKEIGQNKESETHDNGQNYFNQSKAEYQGVEEETNENDVNDSSNHVSVDSSISKISNQEFGCNLCELRLRSMQGLRKHIESIHNGTKYQCKECDYQATNQSNLNVHFKSVHQRIKYPCQLCDHQASQSSTLKRHVLQVHEGKKRKKEPSPCQKCNYIVNSKANLYTHVKNIHEGIMYPCPHCEHKATHNSNLTKHIQSNH